MSVYSISSKFGKYLLENVCMSGTVNTEKSMSNNSKEKEIKENDIIKENNIVSES